MSVTTQWKLTMWTCTLNRYQNCWVDNPIWSSLGRVTHFTKKNKSLLDLRGTQLLGPEDRFQGPTPCSRLLAAFWVEFWELLPLLYVDCFLAPNGAESKLLLNVNAVSTGKSTQRINRKCRLSFPRVYFVTLATSPKLSEPQFPSLTSFRDAVRIQDRLSVEYKLVCNIPFTPHKILIWGLLPRHPPPPPPHGGMEPVSTGPGSPCGRPERASSLHHPGCTFGSAL